MKVKNSVLSVALIAAMGFSISSCKKKETASGAAAAQNQVPELEVMTVGASNTTLDTSYPATLIGENDIEIRPQISGQITKVNVEDGQHVSKGQVLFVIDDVTLQAAVDAAQSNVLQSQAAVEAAQSTIMQTKSAADAAQSNVLQTQAAVLSAQASVNVAQTNVNSDKLLLDKNIISSTAYQITVDQLNMSRAQLNQAQAAVKAAESQYNQAQAAVKSAEAQVSQAQAAVKTAEAQLATAQKNLSYSQVTAPESGVIGTVDYKVGSYVSPQTMLTVLSTNADVDALFSLTEKELLNMTNKTSLQQAIAAMPPVQLELADGTIYPFPGTVTAVSGVTDTSTGSARVKALFPNPNGVLRSGSTAKVLIPNIMDNVITIPQKSTFEIQDLKYVFVVSPDSAKLVSTNIKVSPMSNGKDYIVTEGLKPGDVVLLEGVGISAKEGMPIKPRMTK